MNINDIKKSIPITILKYLKTDEDILEYYKDNIENRIVDTTDYNKFTTEQLLSQVRTYKKQYDLYMPLNDSEKEVLEKRFREEEIFTSNHIEGNQYTLDETRYLLETRCPASGKSLIDGIEIMNIDKGIKYINKYNKGLTESFIKDIHSIVVCNTLENKEDELGYKTHKNYIGDVQTSSVQQTPIHMTKLIKATTEMLSTHSKNDLNVLKIITDFKFRFTVIHPFADGNGRTVRLLINYLLMKYNFIPISILPKDKDEYYIVLKASTKKSTEPLYRFLLKVLIKTYKRRLDWLNE